MKDNELSQLISQLSNIKQLTAATHPALTLSSIHEETNCKNCKILISITQQIQTRQRQMCEQYNRLLKQTHRLIDLSCQFFQEQKKHYEEEFQEMERNEEQFLAKIKQLETELGKRGQHISELNAMLLEKYQQTAELQDRFEKQTEEMNKNTTQKQIEQVRMHRREKSQCNRLQNYNKCLNSENEQLKVQIYKLNEHINQLQDYIKRMEDDLANVNIRSPRIINQYNQFADNCNKTFQVIDQCSIGSASPINKNITEIQSQRYLTQNLRQESNQSLRSSFANKRQVLREVLNISGQTSNYFQFRTKEKIEDSANLIKNYSNNQNNINTGNLPKQYKIKQQSNNILQIKQFQVNQIQNTNFKTEKNIQNLVIKSDNNNKKTDKNKQVCQNSLIDPYYAFFVLTIQCIKLNWKDMNQVANIRLDHQWHKVIQQKIPINNWETYLKKKMKQLVKQIK